MKTTGVNKIRLTNSAARENTYPGELRSLSKGRIGREGGVLNKVLGAEVSHKKVLAGSDGLL